jgi:hypothetical protein
MPSELRIDLESLQGYIEATSSGAISEHKAIHYLLKSILDMGCRWRDNPTIVITRNDVEAELDSDLAQDLDDLLGGF